MQKHHGFLTSTWKYELWWAHSTDVRGRGWWFSTWLVVWNIFYFPIYWVHNHPNWLIFFRGALSTTNQPRFWGHSPGWLRVHSAGDWRPGRLGPGDGLGTLCALAQVVGFLRWKTPRAEIFALDLMILIGHISDPRCGLSENHLWIYSVLDFWVYQGISGFSSQQLRALEQGFGCSQRPTLLASWASGSWWWGAWSCW